MAVQLVGPRWEHGHRCHGYWLGPDRIGLVGIPPSGLGGAKRGGYGWSFDWPGVRSVEGRATTLRAAKRAVEAACQRHYASCEELVENRTPTEFS